MKLFITGTDTDVGKTVFAAALSGALGASYWKPIQAGSLELSDSDAVRRLSGLPPDKILPEGFRLTAACSPHRSAELDSTSIDFDALELPDRDPLVIEGAGGLLVPVTRNRLVIDLIARWALPVVLVARTSLGTINHSLLSVNAVRSRKIPLLGIAFVGDPNDDSEGIICALGRTRRLGRLPMMEELNPLALAQAFDANFNIADFQ